MAFANTRRGLVLAVLCAAVAACSGSGRTARAPAPTVQPAPPPPPPPTNTQPVPGADAFRTAEYNRVWGLDAIGAADAYALGYTGAGVTIGFVDFNFVFDSPEVNYSPLGRPLDPNFLAIYEAQIGQPASADRHGHAVATIAAGIKNDVDTHGVAFDAEVLAVDFFSGTNITQVQQGNTLFHVSNPWTYLTDNGARIVSKSFGFDEGDVISNPPQVDEKYVLDTEAHVVDRGGLLVVSAGNNADPDPSQSNLELIDVLRDNGLLNGVPGAFILAGAVDENNQIAPFSDRAGVASNWFMVAPGVDLVFPWNGQLIVGSGTSLAAPLIAGAAAVILDRWPTLTAWEVREILFDSATDLGAFGVDEIYGHGLLNLSAALQPLGQTTIAVATTGGPGEAPAVEMSGMTLAGAFGDAAGLMSGISNVMMLDGFRRDFAIDLSGLVTTGRTRADLTRVLEARRDWRGSALAVPGTGTLAVAVGEDLRRTHRLSSLPQAARDRGPERDLVLEFRGRLAGLDLAAGTGLTFADALAGRRGDLAGGPLLSLNQAFSGGLAPGESTFAAAGLWLDGATRFRLATAVSDTPEARFHPLEALREGARTHLAAVRLDRFSARARLGAELGIMREDGALLGSRAGGGLDLADRAQTGWLRLDAEHMIGPRLFLALSATGALTDAKSSPGSLFASFGRIASTRFSLRLGGGGLLRSGDGFALTVHQPLRVERAPATLVTGVGRDLETGAVIFAPRHLSLQPSGREIGLEGAYRIALGRWLAEANLAYRFDADHVAGRRDLAILLNLSRPF